MNISLLSKWQLRQHRAAKRTAVCCAVGKRDVSTRVADHTADCQSTALTGTSEISSAILQIRALHNLHFVQLNCSPFVTALGAALYSLYTEASGVACLVLLC